MGKNGMEFTTHSLEGASAGIPMSFALVEFRIFDLPLDARIHSQYFYTGIAIVFRITASVRTLCLDGWLLNMAPGRS